MCRLRLLVILFSLRPILDTRLIQGSSHTLRSGAYAYKLIAGVALTHLMALYTGAFMRPASRRLFNYALGGAQKAHVHSYVGIPSHVESKRVRRLDVDPYNPVGQTAEIIKEFFLGNATTDDSSGTRFTYVSFGNEPVTIRDNFDELQVPLDHVSRKPCDNYYVSDDYVRQFDYHVEKLHPQILANVEDGTYSNKIINRMAEELGHSSYKVLPTHTTSHLPELLRRGITRAIYSGQVFRRDAIDSEHYPVFHQLDGIMLFTRRELEKLKTLYKKDISCYSDQDIILHHLKSTLEKLMLHLFDRVVDSDGDVRIANGSPATANYKMDSVHISRIGSPQMSADDWVRWDSDTSFPFTEPSYELYVKLNGEWVEILGCGKLKDIIITNILGDLSSGRQDNIVGGWAFGIGLERLAMVLCKITDIRQFWEEDERFLRQYAYFKDTGMLPVFKPYSRNPPISRDVSFYLDGNDSDKLDFDESRFRSIFEELSREYVEDIAQLSQYVHPKTGRRSLCYRVTYRAMGENLTNSFVNEIHQKALDKLTQLFNIELR
ncbi:phenylalanine-tRNA ligase [Babesia ovis]|uniref:phenylalanine--tRNA ligase n=1 Tax=Babesia ovis TaxID=5869 RepID=A0A9W5TCT7_BABOV|nr:phenylalanine-tRNA ligase [Babesia ovis]